MKIIAEYFASLDPHTLVLYASLFGFILGSAKKLNASVKDAEANNLEFYFGKYCKAEGIVIFMNVVCIFIAQLIADWGIKNGGVPAAVIGALTLSYFGNDLFAELFGKTRKFGRAIVNAKTNAHEGEETKTPMPKNKEELNATIQTLTNPE